MPKKQIKHFKIKWIHIQALVVLTGYIAISKLVFLVSLTSKYFYVSFLIPFVFGLVSSLVFLYFFSHEDFFPWAKEIEIKENKDGHKWLKRFKHHGKIMVCILMSLVGGPVLDALTLRILFHKERFPFKLFVLIISGLISTLVTIGLAKGAISFI